MSIKIGNLAKAVMKELGDYGVEVGVEVEQVVDQVAEEAARKLNQTAPKLTGDYAAAWTYSTGDTKRTRHSKIVHAEKPEYALTHLLEKGHQNRNGGRTAAKVHIEPVEKEAINNLKKGIRERI